MVYKNGVTLTVKQCSDCGIPFPLTSDHFHKSKVSVDGFCGRCKGCVSIYNKNYYKENKERIKQKKAQKKAQKVHKETKTKTPKSTKAPELPKIPHTFLESLKRLVGLG